MDILPKYNHICLLLIKLYATNLFSSFSTVFYNIFKQPDNEHIFPIFYT